MINGKLIGFILLACVYCFSSVSLAQSNNSTDTVGEALPADNFGIYNWDESLEAWVLLYSGNDEFYATEGLDDDDYLVDPVAIPDGGFGGGGDVDVIGLRSRLAVSATLANEGEDEEPKELEKVVVTGVRPSMLEGSLLSIFWRPSGIGELFGQRSASKKAVPAPKETLNNPL